MITTKAVQMGFQTMIGVIDRKFPIREGNCFSVYTEKGEEFKIANFCAENLKELERLGLSWPIDIIVLREHIAVIHDKRISDRWYQTEFCEICCPTDLLPLPQILKNMREEEREGPRDEKGRVTFYTFETPQFP